MIYKQLTLEERTMVYGFCKVGFPKSEISKLLNRDRSLFYRGFNRNSGLKGYRPKQANDKAVARKNESS